jgi:hypothetical protein
MPYTYGQAYAVAPRNNGLGIASMVLGFVAVIPCFWVFQIPGVLAIIFSVIALSQIKNNPAKFTGRGMAVTGLVLGVVSIAFVVFWVLVGDLHFTYYRNN